MYKKNYQSPLGPMTMLCDQDALIGLWFNGQKHFGSMFDVENIIDDDAAISAQVSKWLDAYFSHKQPDPTAIPVRPQVTSYRLRVLRALEQVPYGELVSYRDLADELNEKSDYPKTSARAVGGAVGHNPISIIIPCHRVVATNGDLTGYAGGIERKEALLRLEGAQPVLG